MDVCEFKASTTQRNPVSKNLQRQPLIQRSSGSIGSVKFLIEILHLIRAAQISIELYSDYSFYTFLTIFFLR